MKRAGVTFRDILSIGCVPYHILFIFRPLGAEVRRFRTIQSFNVVVDRLI